MKINNKLLSLPEGEFDVSVLIFSEDDRFKLFELYESWRNLCDLSIKFKGRAINLPEALSESVFCLETGAVRVIDSISGANSSWDCYDLNSKKRIQVKAASVLPDLTSFGPSSQWDELYFIDFNVDGEWTGKYKIYKIENDDIYNQKVNATETMRDQQLMGRRPRFSIYSNIIKERKLHPIISSTLDISN